MSSPIWLFLTERQRDALLALDAFPAAWPTFDRFTWKALHERGLVAFPESRVSPRRTRFGPRPTLTHAGRAAAGLARVMAKANPMVEAGAP